jgi:hypothetical protein
MQEASCKSKHGESEMETVSEDPNAEAEIGVTPNSAAPNTEAEKKAVECFKALQEIEGKHLDAGNEFGQAMVALRDEIKESGDRDFLARLEELGISYEKARYWMAKVEGKSTDRHRPQARPALDWENARAMLEDLRDDVHMLKQDAELPDGSDLLAGPLASLAGLLGYKLEKTGGDNA